MLATETPGYYLPFGFEPIDRPERWLLRRGPGPAD
jgi:hypothetical protein